jgi:trigger factor
MSSGEDELKDQTQAMPETEAEPSNGEEAEEEGKKRLHLSVDLQNVGPCRKRIKISIPPEDIKAHFHEQFTELVHNAEVPGFRPGHAPRRLIEKKYRKEVAEQVKRQLLMASLEQVGEEHAIQALSEPKIDFTAITVPEDGPMVYEFEVEVSPEFELPSYKGLKIKRPVKDFGEADVNKQLKRFMESYGQLVPKTVPGAEGEYQPAALGDFLIADVAFHDGTQEISKAEELSVRIQPVLRFRDGTIHGFDKAMVGVTPGDTRTVDVQISGEAPNAALQGRTIRAEFAVKDLKRLRPPELNQEFLDKVGYKTDEDLRDALHSVLRRRLEYEQRRVARQQLMDQLMQTARIELPSDLVKRQVQATLRRKVMELRESGLGEDEIRRRYVELQQSSISTTQQSLKEHFILARIADAEQLKVTPEDVENQIEVLALQSDDSPRRVRARLEKEGLLDTLEIQILEQLAVDRALEFAEYENVPLEEEEAAEEAVDQAAVAGEQSAEPDAAVAAGTATAQETS